MKALVVDDVAYSCTIVKKVLERVGIETFLASSGADALDILQLENSIDVVITDLMMPGMDGIQLYECLNKRRETNASKASAPMTPFILLTASPEPKVLQRAKLAGFLDIMVKPLDSKRLIETLVKLLGNDLKEEYNYAGAIKTLQNAINEALKNADTEAASLLCHEMQPGIERLDTLHEVNDV